MSKKQVKLIEPPNTKDTLLELAAIMFWLRHYSNLWQTNFGVVNKNRMVYWQEKADDFINKNIVVTDNEPQILID
ncbi:MAG: hypothetical protein NTZ59_02315 [Bacteroidetes bacterium]|nr:hypothetical protein [Bacteroidota bacterium]